MSKRPKIFDILAQTPGSAADQGLVAGLPAVSPEYVPEFVDLLLIRNSDTALVALVEQFHKFEAPLQTKIVASTAKLFTALRCSIKAPQIQTRLNTLEIVRLSENPRLAYLVGAGLHDGSTQLRQHAAATLLGLTENLSKREVNTVDLLRENAMEDINVARTLAQTLKLVREEGTFLVDTIRDALAHFESHHRPEVLEAAMHFTLEIEDALFQKDSVKRGKITRAILDVFAGSLLPRLAPIVYLGLQFSDLRKKITTILTGLRNKEFLFELIRHDWLARDPLLRKHVYAIRSIGLFADAAETVFAMPDDVAVRAPAWIISLGLPADQKLEVLNQFMLLDNPAANRAAAWALTQLGTPGATEALTALLEHENPEIRTIAERQIAQQHRMERRHSISTRKDRPVEWSRLLDRAGMQEEFDDLWHKMERLDPVGARLHGHYAQKFVVGFTTQIQNKLVATHHADRAAAVRLIAALGLAPKFATEIFGLTHDPAPEVRAATMAALGQIGDATSRRIIERALSAEVPIVISAAVDTLDVARVPRLAELLTPLVKHADASVRGGAVRSLLRIKVPHAVRALIEMMTDQRADHRCASLWVIDLLGLTTLAQRVMEAEHCDPDLRIRRVARHVARRLNRQLAVAAKPPQPASSPPATAPASSEGSR